ncbi:MAG: peptide chain release factor N(5)-glutamine methyltransferase [Gammaproteobacteria bacterium]
MAHPLATGRRPSTIADLLGTGAMRLDKCSDSARLDAELLLAHLLDKPRSFLLTWPQQRIDEALIPEYDSLIARRAGGEPLAYLTGRKEFWSLTLRVNRHTLIPRPETEHLVEQALALLPTEKGCRVADLGTGSGAIALALARERSHWQIVACERCPEALGTARANASELKLDNVEFRRSDWCAALARDEAFDLIVANPPYVRHGDPRLAEDVLRFEPQAALIAGPEGLEDLRTIARQAKCHLYPGGWLLLEHGDDQEQAVTELLRQEAYREIADRRDYGGRPRLTMARWEGV